MSVWYNPYTHLKNNKLKKVLKLKKHYEKYHFCNWHTEAIGHGYRTVEVRSVGPKWVYLREPVPKGSDRTRFRRISRKVWEQIKNSKFFQTYERYEYESAINAEAHRLGIDRLYRSNRYKYGWRHKTFEELEQEVLANSHKFFQGVG